ncbi:MAG TPA: response regulator [Acidobacteriota bacterium]|nr:response regulator [Acidobacteriota bacterium]
MSDSHPVLLLVDDDPSLLALFSSEFSSQFRIITAKDGEEGLAYALLNKPDIILADINMPELNGWELCYLLRQIPSMRVIPFVFLTARAELPDKIKSLRMGADDFISKPFSVDDVSHRVHLVLERVRTRKRIVGGASAFHSQINALMIDLLEYLRATRREGVIEFIHMNLVGFIFLSAGNVVDAQFEGEHGEEALRTMMQLEAGEVTFKEKAVEKTTPIISDWVSFISSFLPSE